SGGARIRGETGRRSFLTASAAGIATGHQVRDSALPSGRPAASAPPGASRTASPHAAPPRDAPALPRFLLLSGDAGDGGRLGTSGCARTSSRRRQARASLLPGGRAGAGQRSPVTRDRRRASSAVAAPVSAAAVTGR